MILSSGVISERPITASDAISPTEAVIPAPRTALPAPERMAEPATR